MKNIFEGIRSLGYYVVIAGLGGFIAISLTRPQTPSIVVIALAVMCMASVIIMKEQDELLDRMMEDLTAVYKLSDKMVEEMDQILRHAEEMNVAPIKKGEK